MVLAMSRPWKHTKTGVYYFRKAIPKELRPLLGNRWEEKISLGTKDPVAARELHAEKAAEVAIQWKALRSQAVSLTHKQIVALAGIIYRDLIELLDGEPGEVGIWEEVLRLHAEARETDMLEEWFGQIVDDVLLSQGLRVDADTRKRLLEETDKAIVQASEAIERQASGDYRPDPEADRFPNWTPTGTDLSSRRSTLGVSSHITLASLVDGWWAEAERAGRSVSTYESYRNTFRKFSVFLGSDDAVGVTTEDVIAYKDHRLSEVNPKTGNRISPRTIKDSDLAALKSVFKWAVANKKLQINPASGVSVIVGQKVQLRDTNGFTDAEAKALLSASWNLVQGRESDHIYAAKKWVPWLCAYTGARVGEMVQLRREDVTEDDGHWVLLITPEAGRVKNKKPRKVVMHTHLIELGFPKFVQCAAEGHLFFSKAGGEDTRGRWRTAKNRLREFIRTVVTDPSVQPSHGWRHRFKTVALEVGMDPRIRDYIQGHAPRTEGEAYGGNTPKAQFRELSKMPQYEL
ncbi:tyrosine-type recombinase/integrase [Thalassospiraceae bacterium LMO-JJ14]|nr:tyrosine-type recombinase/integrase [Thalassospiraceae bacterium LMO-JJ14]